jgi:hypothetical protein
MGVPAKTVTFAGFGEVVGAGDAGVGMAANVMPSTLASE